MRWSEHTIDLKERERELSLEGINFIDHNRSDYACIYLFCLAPLSPELLCPPIVSVRASVLPAGNIATSSTVLKF